MRGKKFQDLGHYTHRLQEKMLRPRQEYTEQDVNEAYTRMGGQANDVYSAANDDYKLFKHNCHKWAKHFAQDIAS